MRVGYANPQRASPGDLGYSGGEWWTRQAYPPVQFSPSGSGIENNVGESVPGQGHGSDQIR